MSNVNINIRMDSNLKKEFEQFCSDVGMTMTTAFTIFAKRTVKDNRIPFDVSRENLNAETLEAIREVQKLKADPNKKTYGSFKELLEDLDD